jgi:hypothetical protein
VADATYDDLLSNSGLPISSNGVFYSASFIAQSAGSGTFQITFLSGFQGFDPVTVTNGTPDGLAFTVVPSVATPAPPSLLLAGLGAAFLALSYAGETRVYHALLFCWKSPVTACRGRNFRLTPGLGTCRRLDFPSGIVSADAPRS